jgi:hypothetical protein
VLLHDEAHALGDIAFGRVVARRAVIGRSVDEPVAVRHAKDKCVVADQADCDKAACEDNGACKCHNGECLVTDEGCRNTVAPRLPLQFGDLDLNGQRPSSKLLVASSVVADSNKPLELGSQRPKLCCERNHPLHASGSLLHGFTLLLRLNHFVVELFEGYRNRLSICAVARCKATPSLLPLSVQFRDG